MIHRALILTLLFILGSITSSPVELAAQGRSYSLEDMKELAVQHYELIKLRGLESKQATLQREIAGAQRFPKLDLDASYTWMSETAKIQLSIPGLFERDIALGDGNIYSTGLTVSAPLFTGFKLSSAVEIRKEAEHIAQQSFDGSILELRNMVARAYLGALLARKQATVLMAQELGLSKTLSIAKNFVVQAQAIPYDTLVISTRIAKLRVARARAKHQELKAQLLLEQLTNHTSPFKLQENVDLSFPDADYEFERLVNEAINDRYEMKVFGSQKRIADLSAKAERGAYYPAVSAFAGYRYGKPGIDQFKNEWMDYLSAGVALKWNLWSWGADKNKVEEQKLVRQKTELRELMWVAKLRNDIESTLNDIDLAKQTSDLLKTQVGQEEEKNTIVLSRYSQGLASSTEVVDTEVALTTARLNLEQTKIEYYIKLNELAAILGKDI